MIWTFKHPQMTVEWLGLIPEMLHESDPRPARVQIDEGYAHGGGWRPFRGFAMAANGDLLYPGDPPVALLAETRLRDEVIRLYDHEWLAIIQADGSFEVCRVD